VINILIVAASGADKPCSRCCRDRYGTNFFTNDCGGNPMM
jgi:hypothetical protein